MVSLMLILMTLSACNTDETVEVSQVGRRVPFVLPAQTYFEEYIQNVGIWDTLITYTIEIFGYEIMDDSGASVMILMDVSSTEGYASLLDMDMMSQLSSVYVTRTEGWLLGRANEQMNAEGIIVTRGGSFIVVVIAIDDMVVGASMFNPDTRNAFWVGYETLASLLG